MTTAVVDILAKFKNQASKEAKRLKDDFENLDEQAKKSSKSSEGLRANYAKLAAGMAGVIAVGKQVIDYQKENIRLAGIQEDAERQLEQVITSTGGAAGLTATELKNMASGFQAVTKFGDEATIGGQSLLLTFTNIGKDVFPQATETMLDMSQALGQDMKSSAVQLGKALNDPIAGISALSKVGVSFTEQQKEQIRTLVESGNTMEAQRVILNELSKEFGGSARAAAETYTGQVEQLSNTYGDLREQLGFMFRLNMDQISSTNEVVGSLTNHLALVNKLDAEVAAGNMTLAERNAILQEVSFTSTTAAEVLDEMAQAEIELEQAILDQTAAATAADAVLTQHITSQHMARQAELDRIAVLREFAEGAGTASGAQSMLSEEINKANQAGYAWSQTNQAAAESVGDHTVEVQSLLSRVAQLEGSTTHTIDLKVFGLDDLERAQQLMQNASGFNANDQPDPFNTDGFSETQAQQGDAFDPGAGNLPPGFAKGGHTGVGPRDRFAGLVHFNETVVPEDVLNRGAGAVLAFVDAHTPGGIGLGTSQPNSGGAAFGAPISTDAGQNKITLINPVFHGVDDVNNFIEQMQDLTI